VPNAKSLPTTIVPAFAETPPENVLAPLNFSNPFPDFVNVPLPPTIPEKTTLTPDAILTAVGAAIMPGPENVKLP
jgi:hypothetical protein